MPSFCSTDSIDAEDLKTRAPVAPIPFIFLRERTPPSSSTRGRDGGGSSPTNERLLGRNPGPRLRQVCIVCTAATFVSGRRERRWWCGEQRGGREEGGGRREEMRVSICAIQQHTQLTHLHAHTHTHTHTHTLDGEIGPHTFTCTHTNCAF